MEALNDIELDDEVKAKLGDILEREIQTRLDQEVSGLKAKNDELISERPKAKGRRQNKQQRPERKKRPKLKTITSNFSSLRNKSPIRYEVQSTK